MNQSNIRPEKNIVLNISSFLSSSSLGAKDILLSSSSNSTVTNRISKLSVDAEKYSKKLIRILKQDEFIPGEISKTQLFLENILLKEIDLFREVFQKTWLKLFIESNTNHIIDFISMASYFEYEDLDDRADALIICGCSHVDVRVNEATIRVVESWEQEKHVAYLKNIKPSSYAWLEKYKENVMNKLERK